MKKYLIILLIIGIFVFSTLYIVYRYKNKQTLETEKQISLFEVNLHNKKDDCWIVIEKQVYDITDFISKHPGGEIIVSACGTDATEKFNSRPILGTSHSSLARKMLEKLKIGSL